MRSEALQHTKGIAPKFLNILSDEKCYITMEGFSKEMDIPPVSIIYYLPNLVHGIGEMQFIDQS